MQPIARAFIELVATGDGLGEDIARELRRELRKLEGDFNRFFDRITRGFRGMGRDAARAIEGIGDDMRVETRQIERAVDRLADDVVGELRRISREGVRAFRDIADAAEDAFRRVRRAMGRVGADLEVDLRELIREFRRLGDAAVTEARRVDAAFDRVGLGIRADLAGVEASFDGIGEAAAREAAQARAAFEGLADGLRVEIAEAEITVRGLGDAFDDVRRQAALSFERLEGSIAEVRREMAETVAIIEAGAAQMAGAIVVASESIDGLGSRAKLEAVEVAAAFSAIGASIEHEVESATRSARQDIGRVLTLSAATRATLLGAFPGGADLPDTFIGPSTAAAAAAAANVRRVGRESQLAGARAVRSARQFGFLSRAFINLGQALIVGAGYAAIGAPIALGAVGLSTIAEFERLRVGLENLLSTELQGTDVQARLGRAFRDLGIDASSLDLGFQAAQLAAESALASIFDIAQRTPFGFQGLAQNAQQLLAAGRSIEQVLGSAAQPIGDIQALGGVAAVLGGDPDDLRFVIRALAQINSSIRPYRQDLNQIIQRLPGFNALNELAFRAAAENAGLSADAIRDLRQQGLRTPQAMKLIRDGLKLIEVGAITGAESVDLLVDSFRDFPGAQEALERFATTLTGQFERFGEQAQLALRDGFAPLRDILVGEVIDPITFETDGLIAKLSTSVRIALRDLGAGVTSLVADAGPGLVNLVEPLGTLGGAFFVGFGQGLEGFIDAITPSIEALSDVFAGLAADGSLQTVGEGLGFVAGAVTDAISVGLPVLVESLGALSSILQLLPSDLLAARFAFGALNFALKRTIGVGAIAAVKQIISTLGLLGTAFRGGAIVADTTSFFQRIVRAIAVGAAGAEGAVARVGAGLSAGLKAALASVFTPGGIIAGFGIAVGTVLVSQFLRARREAAEFRRLVNEIAGDIEETIIRADRSISGLFADRNAELIGGLSNDQRQTLRNIGFDIDDYTAAVDAGLDATQALAAAIDGLPDAQIALLIEGTEPGQAGAAARRRLRSASSEALEELGLSIGDIQRFLGPALDKVNEELAARAEASRVALSTALLSPVEGLQLAAQKALTEAGIAIDDIGSGTDAQARRAGVIFENFRDQLLQAVSFEELELIDPEFGADIRNQINEVIDGLEGAIPDLEQLAEGGLLPAAQEIAEAWRQGRISSDQEAIDFAESIGVRGIDVADAVAGIPVVLQPVLDDLNRFFAQRINFGEAFIDRDKFLEKFKIDLTPEQAARTALTNLIDLVNNTAKRIRAEAQLLDLDLGSVELNLGLEAIVVQTPDTPFGDLSLVGLAGLSREELIGASQAFVDAVQGAVDAFNEDRPEFEQITLEVALEGIVTGQFTIDQLRAGEIVDEVAAAGAGLGAEANSAFAEAFRRALATSPLQPRPGESIFATPGFEIDAQFIDAFIGDRDQLGLGLTGDDIFPQSAQDAVIVKFGETGTKSGTEFGTKAGEAIPQAVSAAAATLDITPILTALAAPIDATTAALQARLTASFVTAGLGAGTAYGAGLLLGGLPAVSGAIGTIGALAGIQLAGVAVAAGASGAAVGTALVSGFVAAVEAGFDPVAAAIEAMASTVTTTVDAGFGDAAAVAIDSFADGLAAGTATGARAAVAVARVLSSAMVDAVRAQLFLAGFQVGQQFTAGIAAGIIAYFQRILRALQLIALLTRLAAYAAFGISSPSKLGIEVGQFVTEGIAKGMVDGIPMVRAAQDEIAAAITPFAAQVGTAMPALDDARIRVRLDVDDLTIAAPDRVLVGVGADTAGLRAAVAGLDAQAAPITAPVRAGATVATAGPSAADLRLSERRDTDRQIKATQTQTAELKAALSTLGALLAELETGDISVTAAPGMDAQTVAQIVRNRVKQARTRIQI